jgi:hypothetical protein
MTWEREELERLKKENEELRRIITDYPTSEERAADLAKKHPYLNLVANLLLIARAALPLVGIIAIVWLIWRIGRP